MSFLDHCLDLIEINRLRLKAMEYFTKAALWRHRARTTAKKNSRLRQEVHDAREEQHDIFLTLIEANCYLREREWEDVGTVKKCPECGVIWKGYFRFPPEHDDYCRLGTAARRVRRAIEVYQTDRLQEIPDAPQG
jgi:hypothetical protein